MHDESLPSETPAEALLDELVSEPDPLPITTGYRLANQIAGVLVVLLGAGLTFGGLSLGLENSGIPGAGVFPVIVGSLLLLLGCLLFLMAILGKLDRSGDTEVPDRVGVRRILITALATGGFVWSLLWIGYPIAMTLYVFALLVFVGSRKLLNSAIIAVVFGVGSYVAFTAGLGVQLPNSALPFLQMVGL